MSKIAWLTERPVAHRGYHDMNSQVWENTLSAFSRAIDAGFSIECDLHYAADGVPVVFHDDDLQRVCNLPGALRDRSSAELGLLSVGGTNDKIPTLKQLLKLCDGKVPLVLELKGRQGDDEGVDGDGRAHAAARIDVADQRRADAERRGGADTLHHPGGDQRRYRPGEDGADRADKEDRQPGLEDRALAEPLAKQRERQQ